MKRKGFAKYRADATGSGLSRIQTKSQRYRWAGTSKRRKMDRKSFNSILFILPPSSFLHLGAMISILSPLMTSRRWTPTIFHWPPSF